MLNHVPSKLKVPMVALGLGALTYLSLPEKYQSDIKQTANGIVNFEKEYFLAESHHGLLGAGLVLSIGYLVSYLRENKRMRDVYEGIHLHNVKCHYVGLGQNAQNETVLFSRPMSFAKSLDSIIPMERDQKYLIRKALQAKEALPVVDLTDPHGKMIFDDIMHVVAAENNIEATQPNNFIAVVLCEDPKDKIDEYSTKVSICVFTPETLAKFKNLKEVKKYKIEKPEDTIRLLTLHNLARVIDIDPPQHVILQLKKATNYSPFASYETNPKIFRLPEFVLPSFRLRTFLKMQ